MKARSLIALAWLMAALAPAGASAGGGDVRIEDERVIAELEVPASPDAVMKLVADPWKIAGLYGDGTTVTRVQDGDCDTLHYAIDSFIGAVNYNVLFCVHGSGARADLAEPLENMRAYEAIWKIEAKGSGTKIHYELLVVPAMKLPQRVIRSSTRRSVRKLFVRLEEELGG